MKLTHYGHACVLVEAGSDGGSTRILIDPAGSPYGRGFEDLRDLDGS